MNKLDDIPVEIIMEICSFMSLYDIVHWCTSSKYYQKNIALNLMMICIKNCNDKYLNFICNNTTNLKILHLNCCAFNENLYSITKLKNLEHLTLSCIRGKSIEFLPLFSRQLMHCTQLTYLNLSGNKAEDFGIVSFLPPHVTNLNLQYNYMNNAGEEFSLALKPLCKLIHVNLKNNLFASSFSFVANVLSSNHLLTYLNIEYIQIKYKECEVLASLIRTCPNIHLHMPYNNIGDNGMQLILSCLQKYPSRLNIKFTGITHLDHVCKVLPKLKYLYCEDYITDIKIFCDSIKKYKKLCRLELYNTRLSSQQKKAIINAVPKKCHVLF